MSTGGGLHTCCRWINRNCTTVPQNHFEVLSLTALSYGTSQMITCHPKKIPKFLLKGGVVQFCPKSPCTRFTTLAQTQADSTLKSQLSTINTLDTNRKEASVDSPPNINYFSSFHHLIIDIDRLSAHWTLIERAQVDSTPNTNCCFYHSTTGSLMFFPFPPSKINHLTQCSPLCGIGKKDQSQTTHVHSHWGWGDRWWYAPCTMYIVGQLPRSGEDLTQRENQKRKKEVSPGGQRHKAWSLFTWSYRKVCSFNESSLSQTKCCKWPWMLILRNGWILKGASCPCHLHPS